MSSTPPDGESRPQYYRTVVAHFEGLDGEPPPGVRVVEPTLDTRQALRGNLYAIVHLVGHSPERIQLSERLLSAIQRTYFTHNGSQSQVLTEAVRQAQLRVQEHNQGQPDQPLKLGVICVGLVKSRLMIAHSGPSIAYITAANKVERYPTDVQTFDMETQSPSGGWEIYRQAVGERTALFIGTSSWLQMVPARVIAGTVAHLTVDNCGVAASGLLAESREPDLPGLLLVIERTETPPAVSRSRVPLKTPPKRPPFISTAGLPIAVTARPPVHTVPSASAASPTSSTEPTEALPTSENQAIDERTVSDADESPATRTVDDEPVDVRKMATPLVVQQPNIPVADEQEPANDGLRLGQVASGLAAASSLLFARSKEAFTGVLPETKNATDVTAIQADNDHEDHEDWEEADESLPGTVATSSFYSDVTAQVQAVMSEESDPFQPPTPASGGRARLLITLAVLIMLLVPALIFAVGQQRAPDDAINGENYLQISETALDNAWRALNNGDEITAREMFLKAEENLQLAIPLLGHSEQADQLLTEIELGLADVMKSHYLYQLFDPLVRFPEDAEPSRVLVAGDNIFVLDQGRQQVDRYEMDALHEFVPDPTAETVIKGGMTVDGATIANMIDMTWQPIITGYEERPKLVVLDQNNQLFSFDQRVDGVQSMAIGQPAVLQSPSQIENFLGRTYLADEGAKQIFRYDAGGLSDAPAGWFPDDARPYMSGLLAMTIDGDIWLLNSEGTLIRYNAGEQVPFSLDQGAIRADEPVDMVLGSQVDGSIYIADAAHDRILVFDKDGTYRYQLIASEGDPLADLRGLFLDEVNDKIYILTKSALYQHSLPE